MLVYVGVYSTSCMHVWLLFDIDRWSLRDAFETNVLAPSWVFPFRLTPLYLMLPCA